MPRHKHLTWEQAAARFQIHLQARNLSPRTVYAYGLEVARLAAYVAPLAPHQVRTDDLRGYQAGLLAGTASRSGRPLSGRNVYRVACSLTAFFRWLLADNAAAQDPTLRLERPKQNVTLKGSVLTVDEARRLLAAADAATPTGLRDRALVEVLYATGVRHAEVLDLDLGDYELRERVVHVRHGKGDKSRSLPLTRAAALRLEHYLAQGRPRLVRDPHEPALFLARCGKRVRSAVLGDLLHRLAAEVGIDKNVTPHTLRRSCATHLLQNKVSLRHIQELLGHEKLSTTAGYLRLSSDELRRELLLHHPREALEA